MSGKHVLASDLILLDGTVIPAGTPLNIEVREDVEPTNMKKFKVSTRRPPVALTRKEALAAAGDALERVPPYQEDRKSLTDAGWVHKSEIQHRMAFMRGRYDGLSEYGARYVMVLDILDELFQ
jgi:hypothetical protein